MTPKAKENSPFCSCLHTAHRSRSSLCTRVDIAAKTGIPHSTPPTIQAPAPLPLPRPTRARCHVTAHDMTDEQGEPASQVKSSQQKRSRQGTQCQHGRQRQRRPSPHFRHPLAPLPSPCRTRNLLSSDTRTPDRLACRPAWPRFAGPRIASDLPRVYLPPQRILLSSTHPSISPP